MTFNIFQKSKIVSDKILGYVKNYNFDQSMKQQINVSGKNIDHNTGSLQVFFSSKLVSSVFSVTLNLRMSVYLKNSNSEPVNLPFLS